MTERPEINVKLSELQSMLIIKGLSCYMLYGKPNKKEREIIINALKRIKKGLPFEMKVEIET